MNNLTTGEAAFLRDITPLLLQGVPKQDVVNLLRKAMKSGNSGYTKDVDWADDQLL